MNYSIVLDIMYLKFGPTGPVWPDTELLMEAMDFVKENRFDAVEFWDWHTRDIKALKEKLDANGQTLVSICCRESVCVGGSSVPIIWDARTSSLQILHARKACPSRIHVQKWLQH